MAYNFTYTTHSASGAEIDVTLLITTAATPTAGTKDAYLVQSVSGLWNNQAVTGLTAPGGYGGNDNLFYPSNDSPDAPSGYFDFAGLGFTVDSSAPGAIAGDDGNGDVLLFGGAGPDQSQDAEYLASVPPAVLTNETLTPACYCRGTLIRTPEGEVAVEALAEGDLVLTLSGAAKPVRWIGRRSYGGRFLAGRRELHPVRILAHALADGVPGRDLLVSAKHAMLLDGVLVPAADLVNGQTVVVEPGLPRVDYYHVELDRHDVILAEGAASETFVDDDSRGLFHNATDYSGPVTPGPALYCAPRVSQGPELETIRRMLRARIPAVERARAA